MMESEAFVANEYVSACFFVDCTGCDIIDGYTRGEKQSHSGQTISAEENALGNFANSLNGYLGTNIPSLGDYSIIATNGCHDGCHDKQNTVGFGEWLWKNFIWWLQGHWFGTWEPPVIQGNVHHHVNVRPTSKNYNDPRPNYS